MNRPDRLEWRAERLDAGAAALTGKAAVERHYLHGEPVHCGDVLELQLADGSWATGRYEWNPAAGGHPTIDLGRRSVRLTELSVLRWPER